MRSAFIGATGAALLASLSSSALAQDAPVRPNFWSIGPTIGTLGFGGEASYLVYEKIVLRAGGSYFDLNCSRTSNMYGGAKCNHDFNIAGLFAGGIVDIHPFKSGWRLSAGLRYTDLEAKDVTNASAKIGNTTYSFNDIGSAKFSIKNSNPAAPYIGFGYDSSHFSEEGAGFKLGFELGALYAGDPSVSVTTEKTVAGLAAEITRETSTLKGELQKFYNFYPVGMLSARIAF
jgi:hypothetical protein